MRYQELPCWTYSTPVGDFTITMNDDEYFLPAFKGENHLGNFWRADWALEALCRDFPGLPEDFDQWDYTPIKL